jgi:hypothetical protein
MGLLYLCLYLDYETGKYGVVSGGIENFKILFTDEILKQKLNVIHCWLLASLCAKLGFT